MGSDWDLIGTSVWDVCLGRLFGRLFGTSVWDVCLGCLFGRLFGLLFRQSVWVTCSDGLFGICSGPNSRRFLSNLGPSLGCPPTRLAVSKILS